MRTRKQYPLPKSPLGNEINVETFDPQAYKKLPTSKLELLQMLMQRYFKLIFQKRNSKFLSTMFLFIIAIFFIFAFVSMSLFFSRSHNKGSMSNSSLLSQNILSDDLREQIIVQSLISISSNVKETKYLTQTNGNLNEC
ncbi:hypothetical protein M0812_25638 [Anaeramoeba flamelloides]|uniref:Uncharacterized protein n=1 Tax=Anaeramoeba flamelloides TaxID=1746091 RepID=A0AAV7YDZ0_9EUKA|nr:hypothetical protein M0812_25638 [Anaeramoeba flamelloides]